MSSKQKLIVIIAVVVVALIGGGFGAYQMVAARKAEAARQERATPEFARDQIFNQKEKPKADDLSDFITPQGKRVLMHFAQQAERNQPPGGSAKQSKEPAPRPLAKQVKGDYCNFPYRIDEGEFYLSFKKSDPTLGLNEGLGVYQFNDMVFTKIKDRKIDDLSMAWAQEHPIQAAIKLTDWKAMGDNFVSTIQSILGAISGAGPRSAPESEHGNTTL